jgi:hypothetical protein
VDYIYRAIDRQINKARGVLAYNGLLFASFGLIARNSKDTVILTLACLAKLVSVSKRLFQQQNLDLQRKFKLSFCRHSSQFI